MISTRVLATTLPEVVRCQSRTSRELFRSPRVFRITRTLQEATSSNAHRPQRRWLVGAAVVGSRLRSLVWRGNARASLQASRPGAPHQFRSRSILGADTAGIDE